VQVSAAILTREIFTAEQQKFITAKFVHNCQKKIKGDIEICLHYSGLTRLTNRKNADAGLIFFPIFRHSGI
jgi:tRNA splicing ligase